MIKNIAMTTLTALLLVGCGGGASESSPSPVSQSVTKAYNLWDYMVPKSNTENTYTHIQGSETSTYNTTLLVSTNRVEEVVDYAQNEKTIYVKNSDTITVNFEKDGKPNGTYNLLLRADIGDVVTKRSSTCKLTKHYDSFTINAKNFEDVLEITCGTIPGYFQKGIGEVAQVENSATQNLRVLSN